MDQGRNRGRTFHRVGQPGVQEELRRFTHGADKQQNADHRQRIETTTEEFNIHIDHRRRCCEDSIEADRIESQIDRQNTEREAKIADPVDDKCLDRRGVGRRPFIPEADQQIGDQPDTFPAEIKLQEIVRRHQRQHEKCKQREVGKEARNVRIVRHVSDRIDMDQKRHNRDGEHHHRGQLVDAERPIDLEISRADPVEQIYLLSLALHHHIVEDDDRRDGSRPHGTAGYDHRRPVAEDAAKQADDCGTDQRQKNGRDVKQHVF